MSFASDGGSDRGHAVSRVAVVTDTSIDLSPQQAAELGVILAPISYELAGQRFQSGEQSAQEFFAALDAGATATLSGVDPSAFEQAFREAAQDHDELVCICQSFGSSFTYVAAQVAALKVSEEAETPIRIINSGRSTAAQAAITVAASRAASSAESADEVLRVVEAVSPQAETFAIDATLDALPEMLARPTPPYARIQVIDCPDSPVGAYREALLLVSCRYLMTPRMYVAASIVTSQEARAANAQNWGYEGAVGEVMLERDDSDFVSTISDPSGLSIRVASPEAVPTGTAMIRYDSTVAVWPVDGETRVHTLSADPSEVHEAWLARGTTVEYLAGDRGSPWRRLRSTHPITCTVAVLDLERPEPKEVERPQGGAQH